MQRSYDIAIVGGGMVGALLALALAELPLKIVLIEAKTQSMALTEDFDARAIALAFSSQQILDALGVWPALASFATPIQHIHVSDKGHFPHVRLHADDLQISALGYVIEGQRLIFTLHQLIKARHNIEFICPALLKTLQIKANGAYLTILQDTNSHCELQAQLLIAADGGNSQIRELLGIPAEIKETGQQALISNLQLKRDHGFTAYERFTPIGPVAMLPHGQRRCTAVIVGKQAQIKDWQEKSAADFLANLQQTFGYYLGRFLQTGKRHIHELITVEVKNQILQRVVIMGNAAHTLLPIAAQGFNLSLRDIASLVEVISQALQNQMPFYDKEVLRSYSHWRAGDQYCTATFTNGINALFNQTLFPIVGLRNLGLAGLNNFSMVKQQFLKYSLGMSGKVPKLMCYV